MLFVIKKEEYLSSRIFNFDYQLFKIHKTVWKQYSVEENMKVIVTIIIPI